MNDECKPQRESEVSNHMGQLERKMEEIGASISCLRERLLPVLKIQQSDKSDEENILSEIVPLATIIRQLHNKLSDYNNDIQEIIETCEL